MTASGDIEEQILSNPKLVAMRVRAAQMAARAEAKIADAVAAAVSAPDETTALTLSLVTQALKDSILSQATFRRDEVVPLLRELDKLKRSAIGTAAHEATQASKRRILPHRRRILLKELGQLDNSEIVDIAIRAALKAEEGNEIFMRQLLHTLDGILEPTHCQSL